jgi:hypothetical protein
MDARRSIIAGLVVFAVQVASAQGGMVGSWVVTARDCFPGAARCTGPNAQMGSWSPNVNLRVRGDTVIIAASPRPSPPLQLGHVDTLPIDGKVLAWMPGRRGIMRVQKADVPSDQVAASEPGSRILWRGETWKIAKDGKSLIHELRGPERGDSTMHATWTYQRVTQ